MSVPRDNDLSECNVRLDLNSSHRSLAWTAARLRRIPYRHTVTGPKKRESTALAVLELRAEYAKTSDEPLSAAANAF